MWFLGTHARTHSFPGAKRKALRLEHLEPRMLLSGGSLEDFLAAQPLLHVDPRSLWTPEFPALATDASRTLLVAPPARTVAESAEVAQALDAFVYDTLANGMPILHSRPGAPASIFLDFDGYEPESWLPFTQDSDGTTFNTTEQATIIESWRQVEAYYSMFDIDITTIQPDVYSQPTSWHVITPSYNNGGVAWSIFPHTTPGSLVDGNWAPFNVQVAIAHEVGHTFGCGHISEFDQWGNNVEIYATFDDPLRGTIMGGTGQPVNTWYLWHAEPWHNPGGPSYLQDDLAYIADLIVENAPAGYAGDGYRADDFGGTIATATALTTSGTTQSVTGIIERLSDADAFSFTVSAAGRYSVAATREQPAGVDLKLSIYDSSGVLVAAEDDDPRDEPKSLANDQYITLDLLTPGTYYAVIESHGNYSDLGKYDLRVDPLPTAWTLDNVGLNSRPGYATYDSTSDTYTLAGSGYFVLNLASSSIGGTDDSLEYLYQTLKGDGSITVRVSSLGTNQNPKAGVMIRNSLDSDSVSASLVLQSSNRAYFYARTTEGGTSTSAYRTATTSYLLRLTRTGDVFRAHVSNNGGSTWAKVGTDQTIDMNETVYIGLVSTANVSNWGSTSSPTNHALNVATFTNVSLTASGSGTLNPVPTVNALTPPSGLTVTGRSASTMDLSWADVAGESGYSVERSTDGINYVAAGTTAAGVTTFTDSLFDTAPPGGSGLPLYQRYFYRVRAMADDESVSQASNVVNDVPRPGPASDVVVNSIVSAAGSPQMVIDWQDASGETGYRVERSANGTSGWTTVSTVGSNVPSATDTAVAYNTRYYYRVVTLDAAGDAAVSEVVSNYSRLAAPAGLVFTAKESYRMAIRWNAVAGATRYQVERSTNGTSYTTLTSTLTTTSYTDTNVSPVGEYYYRVTALNDNATGISKVIYAASPAACELPTPWQTADIGAVGGTGAAKYYNGTFTLIAGGDEIFDPSDEFRYVYQSVSGDFSYTARVASVEDTSYWSKAGLMVRESTAVGAKHAMIYISPNLAVFQWRSSTNGYITDTYGPDVTAPYYVRISRSGNLFTGEISPDGTTWTTVGSQTISMTSAVFVGFALCSRNDTTLNTSTFTITPEANTAPTVATTAAADPSLTSSGTTNLSVLGADDHGEANLTYTWTATSLPSGASQPTYGVNKTNAAKNTVATFSKAGDYTLRVTITDTSGLTTTSTVSVNYTPGPTLTSIVVSPASAEVTVDQTQQFTAIGYDQYGAPLSPQPAFTWSATAGDITSGGLYTAPDLPTVDVVTATSGSVHGTAEATVVEVNVAPVAWADLYNVEQGGSLVRYAYQGVLANDTDANEGDTLTASLVSTTSHGSLALGETGWITYTPNAGFFGTDSFVYRAYDGEAYSDPVTDVIRVLVANPAPGDADRDGTVGAGDAAILAAHWGLTGMTWADGDFNGDGTVNAADASLLAANWGATRGESSARDAVLAEQYGPTAAASVFARQRLVPSPTPARRRTSPDNAILSPLPLAVDLVLAYDRR